MSMKYMFLLAISLILLFFTQPLLNADTIDYDLPESFSWQNINGVDYLTPVKNQAPAPTCEAYALCAALETILQHDTQSLYTPDLSETHLYFYAGGTYRAGYVNIVDAANYLITTGVPDEGCYPDPHRPFDYPFESLQDWPERTVKITEWGWVDRTDEAIKQALIDHGPLAVCMYLCQDFHYYSGGVYEHTWGSVSTGHVMTLVGYDDTQQCWIIKNSAGSDWGEDGYVRMHYDSALFAEWYGEDTGIMYIDGAYGNIQPDVPKVYIETPQIFHTYLYGTEHTQLFRSFPLFQKGAPRLFGPIPIKVTTEATQRVEFYVDNELQFTDNSPPFEWTFSDSFGVHTITVIAYDEENDRSMDVLDVFVIV